MHKHSNKKVFFSLALTALFILSTAVSSSVNMAFSRVNDSHPILTRLPDLPVNPLIDLRSLPESSDPGTFI